MEESFTFVLSSQIDVFQSFTRFFDIDVVIQLKDVIDRESKEGYVSDYVLREPFPGIHTIEREFQFYLFRYIFDLQDVYKVAKPILIKNVIKPELRKVMNFIQELATKEEIIKQLRESNQYTVEKYKEQTGEIRKSYSPRPQNERINFKKFKDFINTKYLDYINFQAQQLIKTLESFINAEALTYLPESYFSVPLRTFISEGSWDKFISICKYYSIERDYPSFQKVLLIKYDSGRGKFIWNGIKNMQGRRDSQIPPLGQFIRKLIEIEIVVRNFKNKERLSSAFLNFFGLELEVHDRKFLGKQISDDESDYANIFAGMKLIIS